MKKMLLCCALLCVTLALFCGSAFAAVEIQSTDSTVTVTKNADETQFTVHKDGVTDGQFYLVMIQQGDATALPTSENLYYLNVYTASGTTFEQTVYPKDLTEGTYAVFLSDYAGTGNGARKQVATLTVGGSGNVDVLYGDVNGDGNVTTWDATVLACHLAGQKEFKDINEQNADCDGNGTVTSWDLTVLYCHFAGQKEFANFPYQSGTN